MRRRILYSNQNENTMPDGSKANVCDVVFANKNSKELVIVSGGESSWNAYPSSTWEPIGIVVIPGEHGVLKDGTGTVNQCGIISLMEMDYLTPENGINSNQGMAWGGFGDYYGYDISNKSDGLNRYDSYDGNGLINYNYVVVVNKSNPTVPTGATFLTPHSVNSYIPIQKSIGGTPQWNNSTSGSPSPYSGNDYKSGKLNPAYVATGSPSSSANCLSDFKGIVNTKIITDVATGQTDWRTASTITHSSDLGYYPAACCCARFKPIGTKAFVECTNDELKEGTGFWYMPACGELGYILPKLYDINQTINALKSTYGVGVQIDTFNRYWSSTESFDAYACMMDTYYGNVYCHDKNNNGCIRAFMRL